MSFIGEVRHQAAAALAPSGVGCCCKNNATSAGNVRTEVLLSGGAGALDSIDTPSWGSVQRSQPPLSLMAGEGAFTNSRGVRRALACLAQPRLVVAHVAHSRVHRMSGHLPCVIRPQQVCWWTFRIVSRQPSVIVRRLEYHRHSIVNRGREFVWICGDDRKGLQPTAVRFLPYIPDASEGERLPIAHGEGIRLLCLRIDLFPLIEEESCGVPLLT